MTNGGIAMEVLIINQAQVNKLLPMRECIEVMDGALAALAGGNAIQPMRSVMWLPETAGALGLMPACLGKQKAMGVKAISVFPRNQSTEYDTHQGVVLLFDTENGRLLAIVDAGEITAIRTAATSAVATRLLARENASELAILGAGTQARAHLEAMLLVRPVRRVRVWSLPVEQARQFVARASHSTGIEVKLANTPQEAIRGADIVCTTTAATEPILLGEFISEGAHINAVGSSTPVARELDAAAVRRSRLFVDRCESTLKESGDFLYARSEGAINDNHILGEIGDIITGKIAGRASDEEITLFKSVGIAVEDIASAEYVYRKAEERGLGTRLKIGGGRGLNLT
jgi:ornithine cyclodeaminase